MARGGNKDPAYNLMEDTFIASTILPYRWHDPVIISKAGGFLRSRFPEEMVDKFLANLPNALGSYFSLSYHSGGQREALQVKMARIADAANELGDALQEIDYLEYGALNTAIAMEQGRPQLAEALAKLSVTPSRLSHLDLTLLSIFIYRGATFLEKSLHGTAQNLNRPLRNLVSLLHFGWLESGLPQPQWVSGGDADDPDEKDQDSFCELVHLILDDMVTPTPTPEGAEAPRPTTSQVNRALKLVISNKKI